MSDRRMDAYYYSFDATGVASIDKVLGAVACAGKAVHHTADWQDECPPSDDHTGKTPVEWIQCAANEAAADVARLRSALAAREAECERLRIFIGDAKEAIDADDVIAAYHILATALTATPAPQHDALTPVHGGEA